MIYRSSLLRMTKFQQITDQTSVFKKEILHFLDSLVSLEFSLSVAPHLNPSTFPSKDL